MKISPLDIYNREFSKATFGYNTRQVHEFLEEVGAAYEKLLKEVNMLQDENEKLKEKLASQTEMEEKLKKIMLTIQDTAREITEQAHQEADIIIKKAEIKAEKMEMELKERLKEEYKALQSLKESRELIKIRFRTMLQSQLEILDRDDEEKAEVYPDVHIEEDIAAGSLELEDEIENYE